MLLGHVSRARSSGTEDAATVTIGLPQTQRVSACTHGDILYKEMWRSTFTVISSKKRW